MRTKQNVSPVTILLTLSDNVVHYCYGMPEVKHLFGVRAGLSQSAALFQLRIRVNLPSPSPPSLSLSSLSLPLPSLPLPPFPSSSSPLRPAAKRPP